MTARAPSLQALPHRLNCRYVWRYGVVATSPAVGIFQVATDRRAGTRVRAGDRLGAVDMLGVPLDVREPNPATVFYVDGKSAGVLETAAFARRKLKPVFATQSGPMLVVDGKLHPRFLANSTSRNRRNGVGVAGKRVKFVLAETPVTFHEFARVFRDVLKTPNALYLDGSISRLYAADIHRNDLGFPMGPIVAVSAPISDKQSAKP